MNEDVDSLNGLSNITSISGDLIIFKTFELTTLDGFDSLNSVGGDLYIGGYDIWPHYGEPNSHLEDITALMNLNQIGKDLIIKYNPKLSGLTGLDSIVFQPINNIEIGENEMLSVCSVKSLCDCLAGNCDIDIYFNASGCNSAEEVEEACLVSVPDFDIERELIVYPNPAKDNIFILNGSEAIIDEIVIYNNLGQEVFYTTEKPDKIDISKLAQGIFIVELKTDKLKIRKKLIIK